MPPHFTHHRLFRYLNFMLLDLHTYAPHYAPLRSRAIRRLFFSSRPTLDVCAMNPR